MSAHAGHIRPPVVAGHFYPADPGACAQQAQHFTANVPNVALPDRLFGGIVPHAGWICSARIAGLVWRSLSQHTAARTIFLTGSVHTIDLTAPALDDSDAWQTPLGNIPIDIQLRSAISQLPGFQTLPQAHTHEHSLEVQLPLLLHTFGPNVKFVPCMIPPHTNAPQWGKQLGQLLLNWPHPVLLVASSDLTHYGPNYGFTPHGIGPAALNWAYETNDMLLLNEIQQMHPESIVPHTREHLNACGPGAIASVLAAAQIMGAQHTYLLEHTNSTRELAPLGHADNNNSVGYAGIVLG